MTVSGQRNIPLSAHSALRLTPQQERALISFEGSIEGELGSSRQCWEAGVRPWPTMDNLVEKGLAVHEGWWDEDTGHIYHLTAAGAAERARLLS